KFGGTSVSSKERWQTVAEVLIDCIAAGARPFVVCSALSGGSNLLEELARRAPQDDHQEVLAEIKRQHRALANALEVDAQRVLGAYFEALERLALGASLTRELSPRLH